MVDVVRQRAVAAAVNITANRRRPGLHGGADVHGAFLVLSSGGQLCGLLEDFIAPQSK